jgi:hypothetical protein
MAIETIDSPGSSNVLQASYDDTSRTLEIAFGNGSIYKYQNVPPEVWAGYKAAGSKGSYVARQIRQRYVGVPA